MYYEHEFLSMDYTYFLMSIQTFPVAVLYKLPSIPTHSDNNIILIGAHPVTIDQWSNDITTIYSVNIYYLY